MHGDQLEYTQTKEIELHTATVRLDDLIRRAEQTCAQAELQHNTAVHLARDWIDVSMDELENLKCADDESWWGAKERLERAQHELDRNLEAVEVYVLQADKHEPVTTLQQ